MPNGIKLPQLAWYEPRELEVRLPDSWQVEVCNIAGYNRPAMNDDQIKAAIDNLIGKPPIRELAKGKNEVVIIFDDLHRVTRMARILPFVFNELAEAGIPDSKIRLVAALANHAPMDRAGFVKKLGEATVARFPVYNHNAFDNCTYVGTTSHGTKVFINAEVMMCDFKIAITCIAPHPLAVFSGGGKIILPGVASIETTTANHNLPAPDRRDYDTNPYRLDMEEAAKLAGLDVIIECIVNLWGDTVAIFAGELMPTHAAGVLEAKAHYLTPRIEGKDVLIANTFAKANEAFIGTGIAYPAVNREGGDVVLIANEPEGQVTHYLLGPFGNDWWGPLGRGGRVPPYVKRLIVYTEYPDLASRGWFGELDRVLFLHKWDDVLQVLQESHGSNTKVAVFPNAEIQYYSRFIG